MECNTARYSMSGIVISQSENMQFKVSAWYQTKADPSQNQSNLMNGSGREKSHLKYANNKIFLKTVRLWGKSILGIKKLHEMYVRNTKQPSVEQTGTVRSYIKEKHKILLTQNIYRTAHPPREIWERDIEHKSANRFTYCHKTAASIYL